MGISLKIGFKESEVIITSDKKQIGWLCHPIPLKHLDVDCVDERNYAPGQIMMCMEAFLEILSKY